MNDAWKKAERLLHEAADRGAKLAVLAECVVPLYPSNAWARGAASFGGWDELWERLWANSVDVPGPLLDRLVTVCRERELFCAVGVNERESERPGTLYNTVVYLGPSGLLARHRKLMPTQHERLFHGIGAGDDLAVVRAADARVGGLICWENRMPMARYAVYRGGPQIWVAPTADDSDGWLASMRHIAIESGAFVVSVPQFIPSTAFGSDFPVPLPSDKEVFGRGGAAVIEPLSGEVIGGPLYDEEGIVEPDCDLRRPPRETLVSLGRPLQSRGCARARAAPRDGAGGMSSSYHDGSRRLQDRFDTRRLAERLEEKYLSRPTIDADDRAFIERMDMFFLATADADGRPQCSYKGGDPGFVQVLDERTIAFPNYDGNGMYLSMGNLLQNPHVGMLFIDFVSARPSRLRLSGIASIDEHDELIDQYPGAQLIVRARATQVFPNCPRYIHRMALVERSRFVPRAGRETPVPDWKKSDWACDVLPRSDPARRH
ncbi:MAG: nitrilase-related carbon-nitrogen hydrolase [Solirubrobacteraceae bacterium]